MVLELRLELEQESFHSLIRIDDSKKSQKTRQAWTPLFVDDK
jgi:hypothetical protein